MNENRVPAGVPTGGQFAASVKGTADGMSLSTPDDHRAAVIAEALGDGPELTADEQRVLAILTDADVSDYVNDYADDIEGVVDSLEMAGNGYDVESLEDIAQRLRERSYADATDGFLGTMSFSADAEAGGYAVGVNVGQAGVLTDYHDLKYLAPDRGWDGDANEVSGLRKAVRIASVLDSDFQEVKARAERFGLIPKADQDPGAPDVHAARQALAAVAATPADGDIDVDTVETMREQLQAYVDAENAPRPPVWPQNDDERAAFEDYQFEVANGDTAIGFRDWYTHRQQSEDV